MIGLYSHTPSIIHRLSAGWKLLTLLVMGAIATQLASIPVLSALLAIVGMLMVVARLPWRLVRSQLQPVVGFLIALFIIHLLLTDWHTGVVVVFRFLLLILLALLVNLTTPLSELMLVLERALSPLRRIGISPSQVSFMLTLAIRFIPVLLQQAHEIREAQWARGTERNPISWLVPLLVRTLHIADALTDALDARGYESD